MCMKRRFSMSRTMHIYHQISNPTSSKLFYHYIGVIEGLSWKYGCPLALEGLKDASLEAVVAPEGEVLAEKESGWRNVA